MDLAKVRESWSDRTKREFPVEVALYPEGRGIAWLVGQDQGRMSPLEASGFSREQYVGHPLQEKVLLLGFHRCPSLRR